LNNSGLLWDCIIGFAPGFPEFFSQQIDNQHLFLTPLALGFSQDFRKRINDQTTSGMRG